MSMALEPTGETMVDARKQDLVSNVEVYAIKESMRGDSFATTSVRTQTNTIRFGLEATSNVSTPFSTFSASLYVTELCSVLCTIECGVTRSTTTPLTQNAILPLCKHSYSSVRSTNSTCSCPPAPVAALLASCSSPDCSAFRFIRFPPAVNTRCSCAHCCTL